MAVGLTASGLLPWPVAFVVVGRDVLLVLGSFIIRAREKRATDAFFDLSTTTFHIKPSLLSKVNTFTQFVLLCSTFGSFAVGWPSAAMIEPLWYITPITTIASGLGYLNGSGLNRKKMTEMAKEFRRKTKT
jgi:cardiolipin synthase